jgi:uncharacterized protein with von Willebrand factor type A (vWA) domain
VRERILGFVDRLRAHDLAISPAETMDAVAAVGAAGVERDVLREALAATLVKDEQDRPTFDTLFDVAFPLVSGEAGRAGKRRRRAAGGEPTLAGRGRGEGEGGRTPIRPEPHEAEARHARSSEPRPDDGDRSRAARRRALMRQPLHLLGPREVEEARDLVRALAPRVRGRLSRRERRRRRGRLDVRRMLRAATASGGVPLRIVRTHRRPDRGDLLALVDLSGSVATASELCLGLVAPAAAFFRRVHTFAYVDRLCPITIEHGHLTPDGPLDLHARSDFGQVLADLVARDALLTRRTLLLVVGDARNNRRPPRADLLRAVRERVQRLVWLVPEPRARWNTGDSVLDRYVPLCDAVLETETLGTLLSAVRATL